MNASVGLDGVDDQVQITGAAKYNLQSFSTEVWVKTAAVGLYGGEVVSNGNNWGIRILTDGNVRFFFHLGNGVWRNLETTGLNLKDNNWHALAVTKDSANVKIYLDGVLKQTFANTEAISYTLSPNIVLGRHGSGDNRFNLTGSVDDLRLWNTVRTASDISTNYNKELTLPQTGLVGYWKFNDNSGTAAVDATGGASAALQNGATWQSGFPSVP